MTPTSDARPSPLRTVARRLTLGAFCCVLALIALLAGRAILSATGLALDPHGYTIFAAILFGALLFPVALILWTLYRTLR